MSPKPLAVLDANVLYTFVQRGFFLFCATEGLYDPLWSQEIVEEATHHLVKNAVMTPARANRLTENLRRYFPEAWGHGFAGNPIAGTLPDEGDRHVIDLAVHYEADYIVTSNIGDFPACVLTPYAIEAVKPDRFAEILCDRDMEAVFRAAEEHRCSMTKSLPDTGDYLASLRSHGGVGSAVDRLTAVGFVAGARLCDALP
ncbi:MAG TPA: PIN domain-containing protein [Longimicrobium sp.]|jgi:predicted nucleic acid-binding protein|uniref:PIN domain-containing protein n=1 Tax=Longimicrobium sp. TaxID=2029185 RepID=UPI002EDA125D